MTEISLYTAHTVLLAHLVMLWCSCYTHIASSSHITWLSYPWKDTRSIASELWPTYTCSSTIRITSGSSALTSERAPSRARSPIVWEYHPTQDDRSDFTQVTSTIKRYVDRMCPDIANARHRARSVVTARSSATI